MSPLHGLRLNCVLAPLLAAVLGSLAVLAGFALHRHLLADQAADASQHELTALARLVEADVAPALDAWLAAQRTWSGVAQVRLDGDVVEVLDQAGTAATPPEATPDLTLAYAAPRRWRTTTAEVHAVACLPDGAQPSLMLGWTEIRPDPPVGPWLGLAAGVLLVGGGLGLYLVRRVYRPVEWFQQAAEAAAAGADLPGGAPDGPETASLRSSIATLLAGRRQTDGGDADRGA